MTIYGLLNLQDLGANLDKPDKIVTSVGDFLSVTITLMSAVGHVVLPIYILSKVLYWANFKSADLEFDN